eukprot:UN19201
MIEYIYEDFDDVLCDTSRYLIEVVLMHEGIIIKRFHTRLQLHSYD